MLIQRKGVCYKSKNGQLCRSGQWNSRGSGTEDDPQSGHPKTSTTDEQLDAIYMILEDRYITVQLITKSTGSVHTVKAEILKMSKFSARWVPRMLRPEHKLKKVDIS